MKLSIHYKKNPHQKEFHEDDETKLLHLSAGYAGGKSYGLVMKMIKLSFLNKNLPGGLVCPSYADYRKDILPMMEDILSKNRVKFFHHKSHNYFIFPWSSGRLYIDTAEKRIRGPNWAYAGINELTLIPLERYREVIARVRIKDAPNPQIVSSGTPEGIASDYYEIFVDKPWPGSRIIYGDTRNNSENLEESYIKTLENSFDSIMIDAYVRGLFVNMTGNRFYYSYDPIKNDDPRIEQDDSGEVHISLDFNVDPMVATCWNYTGHGVEAFDEVLVTGTDTTNKMSQALRARGYHPDQAILYPDPSGQSRSTKGQPDVEILKRNGFHNIRIKSHAPTFRQRQLNVNNLLDKGLIRLNPLKCPSLKKDLMGVEQDKITLEKVKTNPKLTHSSDGLDYLCDILFPYSGHRQKASVVKIR